LPRCLCFAALGLSENAGQLRGPPLAATIMATSFHADTGFAGKN